MFMICETILVCFICVWTVFVFGTKWQTLSFVFGCIDGTTKPCLLPDSSRCTVILWTQLPCSFWKRKCLYYTSLSICAETRREISQTKAFKQQPHPSFLRGTYSIHWMKTMQEAAANQEIISLSHPGRLTQWDKWNAIIRRNTRASYWCIRSIIEYSNSLFFII